MSEATVEFIPPSEAPVFEPTWEEFQNPLQYIAKIKPIAEKSGICKIKPPPRWQPPFAVNVDTFKFVPRLQRLNELEASSRVKLNFLDHLAKFWELQGSPLRIPCIERKYVDLYHLQKLVAQEGGFEVTCKERKWSKIVACLGYPCGRGIGSTLRTHYEHLLYPYDLFSNGTSTDINKIREMQLLRKLKSEEKLGDEDYTPNKKSEGSVKRPTRASKSESQIDYSMNSELKKLQFYGPGPKMAVPDADGTVKSAIGDGVDENGITTREKPLTAYVDLYLCHICNRGDGEEDMLLCDGCDGAFHTYCLVPLVTEIPKGDWRCPECVALLCDKPVEAYGFEQSKKEYSLQTFGEMADQFKLDYFNMPVHMVPCSTVEKEFWRLVHSIGEDVVVQYGADVHAMEMGSGFPTEKDKDTFAADHEYMESGWNLNNLPILSQSVLNHISADISGMKIPWCYVGMCFSCFCWHTEDHWSYSINYMHWGEPKTWYGVPGSKAEMLEECVKKRAPELFEQAPDLMHQLTTIMNPNVLQAYGVPITRTDQHAGEFVITFPRSYHAGFNQGYNFAEAVNFCPADWLPFGRSCVEHYSQLHRQCVFSHEELICKMAADPDRLDLNLAACVHQDMLCMVNKERHLRKTLLDRGTSEAEREAFELLPDDERQCDICKTTCFLSAVTCPCSPSKLVCIQHVDKLCDCSASCHCLRYRYTLDELPAMLHRLKVRAESFDNWAFKVKTSLEAPNNQKLDITDMKELITEASEKKFPDSPLMQTLLEAVAEAEKCASVASQLVSKKVRTRHRESGDSKYIAKLSLEELQCFSEQVNNLSCKIQEAKLIQDLLQTILDFQLEATDALEDESPDSSKLAKLMEFGVTLDVELPEIPTLKLVLQQAHWLDEVREAVAEPNQLGVDLMRRLMQSGVGLSPHPACERAMAQLQELLTMSERWEEKARVCLQARPRHTIQMLEGVFCEATNIPALLPNMAALDDALRKAKDWTAKVDTIQACEHYPYLETLEGLVGRGRAVPVRLAQLPQLESQVAAAKSWRERTARTFLKKNSSYSLVELLSPRTDIGMYQSGRNKKKKTREGEDTSVEMKMEEIKDPATIVASFKACEQQEVECMRELRARNMEKPRQEEIDAKYCVCRTTATSSMLQCQLCKDWFHNTCVSLPKSAASGRVRCEMGSSPVVCGRRDIKFLCALCLRSRRPRLETILSLLVSLQKLPVRLAAGEALQCLTERAMAWQDRARHALATDELAAALARLSMLSQRALEQAARAKTQRIISAELLKAASNPDLQAHLQSVAQGAFGPPDTVATALCTTPPDTQLVPLYELDTDNDPQGGRPSEHTYSTVSKCNPASGGVSPHKCVTTTAAPAASAAPAATAAASGGSTRLQPSPVLELSELAKAQLEELMMEGDLLEVSLDETQHIWRILQACQLPHADRMLSLQQIEEGDLIDEKMEREKKVKKRRKARLEAMTEPTETGLHGGVFSMKKVKVGKDKIKRKFKDGEKLKDGEKKKKKKVKKDKDVALKKKKRMDRLTHNLLVAEEEEDLCSAIKCLKPTGEVTWVQCDTCELWFHLLCVGLGSDEVSANEDYVCFVCKKSPSAAVAVDTKTEEEDVEDEEDGDSTETEMLPDVVEVMEDVVARVERAVPLSLGQSNSVENSLSVSTDHISGSLQESLSNCAPNDVCEASFTTLSTVEASIGGQTDIGNDIDIAADMTDSQPALASKVPPLPGNIPVPPLAGSAPLNSITVSDLPLML